MCGRFTLNLAELADLKLPLGLDAIEITDWCAHYNIAPTQLAPVATQNGSRVLRGLRWGLVPHWAQDPSIGGRLINARVESVADKPSFREPYRRRRCIVPASGFYEWKPAADGGRNKQPMWIHREAGEPLLLAGLWDRFYPAGGEPLDSFTIVTMAANHFVRGIHDRMPMTLARTEDLERWLGKGAIAAEPLAEMVARAQLTRLAAHPVDRRMNATAVDDARCIAPAAPDASGHLGGADETGADEADASGGSGRQLGLFD